MTFVERCAAILASAFLLGAAPGGLTLGDGLPDHLADVLLARVLAKAGESGLSDTEGLGRPFPLFRNGAPLGVVVLGRGSTAGPGGGGKTCFVALVEPGDRPIAILPVPGRDGRGAAGCHGYTAFGLLPAGPGTVRLGILFDMDGQPSTHPVVLAWRDGQMPGIDAAGTAACVARHATTIAAMRRPGCGKPSALERAFPSR